MYTVGNTTSDVYQSMASAQISDKAGILLHIANKKRTYITSAETCQSERESNFYYLLSQAFEAFEQKVASLILFDNLEQWWFYNFNFAENVFQLLLCHVAYFEIEEGDMYVNEFNGRAYKKYRLTYDAKYPIFSLQLPRLSVGEFALREQVTEDLVRRWIRRGKLRTAYQVGGQWLIPNLTQAPDWMHYEPVTYSWDQIEYDPKSLPETIPDLKKICSIHIARANTKDNRYEVQYVYKNGNTKMDILNPVQREKLELLLLSKEYITTDVRHF